MSSVQTISAVLSLLAGVGVFLVACSMMSSNLESLGSSKLRSLFAKAAKSKLLGVAMGAIGTAAIQSSGATTVIVIGFVNAGIMSLTQAATVIYGANIGTTITGQIVAWGISGEGGLSTTVLFSALAGVGAFVLSFASREKTRSIGGIIAGFGMLFVGLSTMSGAMKSFAELESVRTLLATIDSVAVLVLLGAVFTAVIQSSSVMTSVAITMVVAGLISLDQGIYLTMGSNIGSCVVSIVAGVTGSANAKRASYIHLLFNVFGVAVFLLLGQALIVATHGSTSFGSIFDGLFPGMPQVQLAMFHTVFNVVTVVLVLPLTNALVAFATKLVPDDKPEYEQVTIYLDDNFLESPPIAVQQVHSEIVGMAGVAQRNFEAAIHMVRGHDFGGREEFNANAKKLDALMRGITHFCSKLFSGQLSERDSRYLSQALGTIADLERVGDYAKHIVEHGEELAAGGNEYFSQTALDEIVRLSALEGTLFGQAVRAYEHNDEREALNAGITQLEISDRVREMSESHALRISSGRCSPDAGMHYLSLISDIQRVGAHFYRVAQTVRGS